MPNAIEISVKKNDLLELNIGGHFLFREVLVDAK